MLIIYEMNLIEKKGVILNQGGVRGRYWRKWPCFEFRAILAVVFLYKYMNITKFYAFTK